MLRSLLPRFSECVSLHHRARSARGSHPAGIPVASPRATGPPATFSRPAREGTRAEAALDNSLAILFPRPLSRLRERVAGALHALAARMKRDGRVRAGGRTRPTVVESHDAPILAAAFFGVCITPPPRAQRARLSSGWHSGRKSKSDRTASHLLSQRERRDKGRGATGQIARDPSSPVPSLACERGWPARFMRWLRA